MLSVTISAAASARRPATASTSTGAPSSTDGDERGVFGGERVVVLPRRLLDAEAGDTRHRRAAPARYHRQPAIGKIHRKVAVLREHPHAPLGAHGDARGGDRRHRAVGEADARIGHVGVLAGHRGADGIDAVDLARHQRQDQVEVVDHQVEDHRHVGAALLERRDARRLDVERRAEPALHRGEGGGETLQVADLQHQSPLRRQRGQLIGLGQRGGDRLLHQHVLARPQRLGRQRVVRLGRCGDHQRVTGGEQRRKVERRRTGFPANGLARSASGSNTPASAARSEAATFSAW